MDENAPISWIIAQINSIVSSGASSTAGAISGVITPVVAACFGIYIILICVNYMRGAESEPVIDFFMRIAAFAVVIGLGLSQATYTDTVIPMVTGIGPDISNAISGGNDTANSLDQLALHYLKILEKGYEDANRPFFPKNVGPLITYAIKAAWVLIGLVPFIVAATLCLVVADVGAVMVASVGPLFFAFLLFPSTRQYFSAWLNAVVSFALVPVFVAVVATVSIGLSKKFFEGGGASLEDTSMMTVALASMGNLVLLCLLKKAFDLASSLSAGGINFGAPGGLGAAASAARGGMMGTARDLQSVANVAKGVASGGKLGAIKAIGQAVVQRAMNRNNGIQNKRPG